MPSTWPYLTTGDPLRGGGAPIHEWWKAWNIRKSKGPLLAIIQPMTAPLFTASFASDGAAASRFTSARRLALIITSAMFEWLLVQFTFKGSDETPQHASIGYDWGFNKVEAAQE